MPTVSTDPLADQTADQIAAERHRRMVAATAVPPSDDTAQSVSGPLHGTAAITPPLDLAQDYLSRATSSLRAVSSLEWATQGTPQVPEPAPASTLAPTDEGFEISVTRLGDDELGDLGQRLIHERMLRRLGRLQAAILRIANSHAALADEFQDYVSNFSADYTELDIRSIFSSGQALAQFIDLHDPSRLTRTMTEPLEPSLLAQLQALISDHKLLMEGSKMGREMRERIERFNRAGVQPQVWADRSRPTLSALLNAPNLIAKKARHLLHALLSATDRITLPVAVSVADVTHNTILSIATSIHQVLMRAELLNIALVFAGCEHPDVLLAGAAFIHDHSNILIAMMADDPQMRILISWQAAEIERRSAIVTAPPSDKDVDV